MNTYVGVGRLVKDVEVRYTTSNKACTNFTIAINRPFKNEEGIYETDFINCECWGQVAETMKNYLKKGDLLGIKGSLRSDSYEDKDGNKKYRTYVNVEKVTFLQFKKEEKNEIGNDLPTNEMPF